MIIDKFLQDFFKSELSPAVSGLPRSANQNSWKFAAAIDLTQGFISHVSFKVK